MVLVRGTWKPSKKHESICSKWLTVWDASKKMKSMRKERWHFHLIRWRYLVTLITVMSARLRYKYSDKMKLQGRIIILSTHLSHKLFLKFLSTIFLLIQILASLPHEGSRLEHTLVNSVQILFYMYSK